ncbi:hypothetical protein ACVWXL_002345 [Bradyrhizobium sp. GM22.5]
MIAGGDPGELAQAVTRTLADDAVCEAMLAGGPTWPATSPGTGPLPTHSVPQPRRWKERDGMVEPTLPGDWKGLVVLCAANSWDSVKFADQHMAEALAKIVPVLYVDPAISVLSPLRRPELRAGLTEPRLRLLAPNLARLTPVVLPGPERPGMAAITTAIVRRAQRKAVEALLGRGGRPRAVIGVSALVRTLGTCHEELKVYWAQDDFVGGALLFGTSAGRIADGERRLAASADLIVASSPTVADSWRARGRETTLIPFGADAERFAATDETPVPEDVVLKGPIAGFVGHLGDRIELSMLEAVADTGTSLLLVGPRHPRFELKRMERLLARTERPVDRAQAVRGIAPLPADDRRRLGPVRRHGVQPGQLPAEDARVSQRRARRRGQRPARDPVAHGPE